MRARLAVAALVACSGLFASTFAAAQERGAPRFAVHAARLIDGRASTARGPVWVIVSGDTIEAVRTSAPDGIPVTDLGAATLLPGLIDCHTHLGGKVGLARLERLIQTSTPRSTIAAVGNARATIEAGFTTCRDLGSSALIDVALRDAIGAGEIVGPRLQVATWPLSITGGHGDRRNSVDPHWCNTEPDGVADGVDEVRKKVRFDIQQGADVIKIHATGGVLSYQDDPTRTSYTLEEMKVAVEEATRLGRFVAAHAHGKQGVMWASTAGVRSVEHASYMDAEAARVLRKNGTYYVPTLYVIEPILAEGNPLKVSEQGLAKAREVRGHMRNAFRTALREGVKIAFGTDVGVFPHGAQTHEFKIYVDEGMTPMQAIQSATRVAAECMGWSRRVGTVEPGRFADMIAVQGDPLRNITELERVQWVMKGGRVVKGGPSNP